MRTSPHRNVSLARALSKLGLTSRSRAEQMIKSGLVTVNGTVVGNPTFRVAVDTDHIAVVGKKLERKECIYIVMNKPVGVITTRSDDRGRTTVYDILGDVGQWVFPVGRLDKDSSGLLLLTNDNRLGEQLTNPESKVPKTYRVQLDKPISRKHIDVFEDGMMLDGEQLLPANIRSIGGTCIEVTILEGKNRQIRRMCESLDYRVIALMRTTIGNLSLGDLPSGRWKYFQGSEIKKRIGVNPSGSMQHDGNNAGIDRSVHAHGRNDPINERTNLRHPTR